MSVPLHPLMGAGLARYERPVEVELCRQAASKGDVDEVKKLVQRLLHEPRPASELQGPHPAWLYSSLDIAIRERNLELVRFLLDENVHDGDLPVESAVRTQAFEVLELFLQYGWNMNKPMGQITPPVLSIPLCTGDREMVEWLLDHGADPNARCVWDLTPTSQAMHKASLETIDYLFTRGADARYGQLLHHAVLRNKPNALDVVRRVAEQGAPINEVKYEKEKEQTVYWEREPFGLGTPLHRAAEWGKKDIVKYLLQQGADPWKLDSRRKTPRFWAEKEKHVEVASILNEAEDDWSSKLSNL